jgi:hypothetical protein
LEREGEGEGSREGGVESTMMDMCGVYRQRGLTFKAYSMQRAHESHQKMNHRVRHIISTSRTANKASKSRPSLSRQQRGTGRRERLDSRILPLLHPELSVDHAIRHNLQQNEIVSASTWSNWEGRLRGAGADAV